MNLSTAQTAVLNTWLSNNAAALNDDDAAKLINTPVAPAYFVWKSNADKQVANSAVVKGSFTPADAPPVSPSTDMTFQNRALLAQLKQTNAQWITSGTGTIDARAAGGDRQNLKDCLTAIPCGVNGANLDAGWGTPTNVGAVRATLMRGITTYEQLFVTASSGPGNVGTDARGLATNPDVPGIGSNGLSIEGSITAQNISDVRGF